MTFRGVRYRWRMVDEGPRAARPLREGVSLLISSSALTCLTLLYDRSLRVHNPTVVALSFLLLVLVVATVSTQRVAVVTSLLAFLAFDYFFLPPLGGFSILDPRTWIAQNWLTLFTLLTVSFVASQLSSTARRRARDATGRRNELARLLEFTRDILLITEAHGAMPHVAQAVAERFRFVRATVCLPGPDGWILHHSSEPGIEVDRVRLDEALAAARSVAQGSATEPPQPLPSATARDGAHVWLVPLRFEARPVGFLAVEGSEVEPGTLDAIAGVTAIAIERTHLLEQREEAEVRRRGAELKVALLASLEHGLRTPLTAVTVAANNLKARWLGADERAEQIDVVLTELARLNRLFQNITEMARIDTKAVAPEREWVQPSEIVEAAVCHVAAALQGHELRYDVGPERTFVLLDPRLTSAALAHVLENAAQYSPPGSAVDVHTEVSSEAIRMAVRDRGPGLEAENRDRLFERFYRGASGRQYGFGTGMGLAIAQGLLTAQGGRVVADNHPAGGAIFTLILPVEMRSAQAFEEQTT
jgi:two-component system sensor histidine kinase KdpD